MADLVFDEDTIKATDPDEVIASGQGDSDEFDDANENLVLNNDVWPGQWEVTGAKAERDLDKKKPWGQHGYKVRNKGIKGGKIVATGTLTAYEYGLARKLIRAAAPSADSGIESPLTLSHPDCNDVGIVLVYIESLEVKRPNNGKDFHRITIEMCQWFAEPKEVGKPNPDHPLGSEADRMNLFQDLTQDPGPFGIAAEEAENAQESMGEAMGRVADRFKHVHSPDQIIPPYTEG